MSERLKWLLVGCLMFIPAVTSAQTTNPLDEIIDVSKLCLIRAQKLAPRWRIKKQVLNIDGGSVGMRSRF